MQSPADSFLSAFPSAVDFGREICCDLAAAESREWLVTNGIGGYAFGTVAGHQTRSYHGLLSAALQPPLGRTLLLEKLDETARYAGGQFQLATNRWADRTISPKGFCHIERFRLEGTTPVWTFALADALLEKRVFMQSGANTTYILYRLVRASAPVALSIKALADYCAEHGTTTAASMSMDVAPVGHGLRVTAFPGAVPYHILSDSGIARPAKDWYRGFDLSAERARGLRDRTDHFFAGDFTATISLEKSLTIVASTEASPLLDGEAAYAAHQKESRALLGNFYAGNPEAAQTASPAVQQLVLAADQFVVARPLEGLSDTQTIIAGYPWFGDWGRDTMIALSGLCLATGRPWIARNILRTFARFVSEGMLPNRFPRAGAAPEYNTADATLWYFQAVREYFDATRDIELLRELYPVLAGIVEAHVRGTRYNIHVDPADGLLYAGKAGIQLTWMDAKVGDRVVTPRIGKPVEINALWLNAATTMAEFSRALGRAPDRYAGLAQRARTGFERFWNPGKNFCFDVIDGPGENGGNDAALRPNQIFAVSLPESALTPERQRAVVDVCERELLTSFGLRSLGCAEPGYQGRYAGSVEARDAAYHQGTAWGWLLGPFALAHLRVYHNVKTAMSFLEPMLHQVETAGLGTASEIFNGDEPFAPNGCIAQAWTVGETLRAWLRITAARNNSALNRRADP
ncbi:MAG TPA: amylo-alpha-1,6-glucosidase [Candidatus Dormibacteraeota bacterium]|nr:amylo-alpha-1,6-glucosidase [Candidatus Dormibacteraeota bacterium]